MAPICLGLHSEVSATKPHRRTRLCPGSGGGCQGGCGGPLPGRALAAAQQQVAQHLVQSQAGPQCTDRRNATTNIPSSLLCDAPSAEVQGKEHSDGTSSMQQRPGGQSSILTSRQLKAVSEPPTTEQHRGTPSCHTDCLF
jgi:hypothetical protein